MTYLFVLFKEPEENVSLVCAVRLSVEFIFLGTILCHVKKLKLLPTKINWIEPFVILSTVIVLCILYQKFVLISQPYTGRKPGGAMCAELINVKQCNFCIHDDYFKIIHFKKMNKSVESQVEPTLPLGSE